MEIPNLLIPSDSKALSDLLSSYSTNENAKEELLINLLTGNPYDINVRLKNIGRNENQKLVDSLLFNIGVQLVDIEEGENSIEIE